MVYYTLSLESLWPQKHISLPVLRFSVDDGVVGAEAEILGETGTLVSLGGARNQHKARIKSSRKQELWAGPILQLNQ